MYVGRSFITSTTQPYAAISILLTSPLCFALSALFLIVVSAHLSILATMCKYNVSSGRRSVHHNTGYTFSWCSYTKLREALYLLTILIVSAITTSTFMMIAIEKSIDTNIDRIFNVILPMIYLGLSFPTTGSLAIWTCTQCRKKRLKRKIAKYAKRAAIVSGVLYILLIFTWTLSLALLLQEPPPQLRIAVFAFYPVVPSMSVLVLHVFARTQKKERKEVNEVDRPTVPPSTRVSLPSDTAAHAPNFLSPNTAEPTEVTSLVN